MLRIGTFARFAQVSVATLHHYDDIDLLKPMQIDTATGYRLYSARQLYEVHRILVLKELGLTLEQIKEIMTGEGSTEQLRSMLKLKQIEERQRLQETQERLHLIELRLNQLERERQMSDYDIQIKVTPSQLVASKRIVIPTNDEVPEYLELAFDDVYKHLEKHNVKVSGPCFSLWHSSADTYENEDVEAIFPIALPLKGTETIRIYTLKEIQVASAMHQGNFDDFTQLHTAILAWIEDNGYRVSGPYREVYIEHDPSGESTTEVQFEVQKVTG